MHLGIKNIIGGAAKYLFGDGSYSQNIIQGGSVLQPQASYELADTTDLRSTATYSHTGAWTGAYPASNGNDGNTSTMAEATTAGGQTAVWCFPSAVNIRQIGIYTVAPGGMGASGVALEYSDDGASWSATNQTSMSWSSPTSVQTKSVNDCGAHRWWRLRNTGTSYMQFAEIAWYQRITLPNCIVITGAATVAPDPDTGASVFTAQNVVVDGGSLAPSTNSKGLIGVVSGSVRCLGGGRVHIDKLGKAGNFGNLTVLDLVPASLKRKLKNDLAAFAVLGEGAEGAAASTGGNVTGLTGTAATAMQTGGGGGGGRCGNTGAGGKGGPCCGGAGSGGSSSTTWIHAGPYGGPGGAGIGGYQEAGGAGDPVGAGVNGAGAGQGPGGGLLMLLCPTVAIASGCIVSADGAGGGNSGYGRGGGGAGGGCVALITLPGGYSNAGTVRANGGPGGAGASGAPGGPGGAGSVNILTV